MAANDSQNPARTQTSPHGCLSPDELAVRLDEEVHRAARHHTALSCLLVSLEDIGHLTDLYGEQFAASALSYVSQALARQLRRFDRIGRSAAGELLVVLPGADERRGEIVARRALGRLHAVKIEVDGERRPLRVSVGIAAWRENLSAEHLLSQTRLAARRNDRREGQQTWPGPAPGASAGELPLLRRS